MIDMMDVKIAEETTARPEEAMKTADLPEQFARFAGPLFGKGGRQKLADFKPGTPVIVVFSELTGVVKAENIRTEEPPKPKPPKKPEAKKPAPKKK